MPKFAANLSLLWTELPYLDRFAAAAEAGFDGVEVLFPYEFAAQDTRRALIRAGLEFVLMNAPPPNYTGGTPGYAALPGDRFARDVRRVMRYAEMLRPRFIHIMSGYAEGDEARDIFVDNLRHAADAAPAQMFTIEPLNPGSFPGYFLDSYDLAFDILDRVDRPNVGLQYDTFHAQQITGDAVATWQASSERAVHVQISDAPDRTAPGTGILNFRALFEALRQSGYDGWISAEYAPKGRTEASLDWMRQLP